jgi:CheY-like chemotaxis protein
MGSPVEILLVEDTAGDVRLTQEALKEGKIHTHLSVANDGESALAFLRRQGPYAQAPRPDLILLDLNLPRKGGREVLAEIKADEALRRIPVVVLTNSQAEQDILESYSLNANCYITKPVDLDQFIKVVRSIEGSVSSQQLVHSLRYALGRHQRHQAVEEALRASEEEMRIARQIQQHLFPAQAPARPGYDIHGASSSVTAAGGDYFDYLSLPGDGLGLVVGDVTGHGVGPALLMAATRAYLRAFAQTQADIGQILALTNRVLAQEVTDGRNVTLLARLDCRRRTLLYTSAGHPTGYGSTGTGRCGNTC